MGWNRFVCCDGNQAGPDGVKMDFSCPARHCQLPRGTFDYVILDVRCSKVQPRPCRTQCCKAYCSAVKSICSTSSSLV